MSPSPPPPPPPPPSPPPTPLPTPSDRLRQAGILLGDEAHDRLLENPPLPPTPSVIARLTRPELVITLSRWLLETADEWDEINSRYPQFHVENADVFERAVSVADQLLAPAPSTPTSTTPTPPDPLPDTQPLRAVPDPSPADAVTAPYTVPLTDAYPTSPSPPSTLGLS